MISKSFHVFGLVQGVFFRFSTKKKAEELHIHGTVQNVKDGSVFIEATGGSQELYDFEQWVHRGPSASRVDKIDIKSISRKSFSSFEIIR